nr:cadherin-like domain-containing protein [Alphaproteobacteria bacterium]
MAEETPNPGQGVPDEEDEEGDAQQTLDDLTVLTEGEQADTGAEVQGVSGGEAEPEDRTLGTIHSGSQQTENEILDNLAPQQAPIVEVPEIAESEIQDRGVQVADIQTATIDAGTESEGETSGIGGSRSFGPGDGPAGTGLDRAGGNDGGVAGRQRDGAPDETGGGAADDGGVENVPVTPTPVTPTAGETPPTETPVVAATETPTVPVVKPPVPETAPALNEELLASAPTPTPAPVPANVAPVAADDTGATGEDAGVTINVLANDTDADGGTLSVTGATLPDGVDGTVVVNADGTVSFTPGDAFDALGVGDTQDIEITYTISDGQGGTDTATTTVTVTGTNDGPVASDESVTAPEDGGAVTGQLDATDIDGDSLTYTQTGDAVPGLTVNADGSYSFDPGAGDQDLGVGETAEVTFTYEVSDGQGGTST